VLRPVGSSCYDPRDVTDTAHPTDDQEDHSMPSPRTKSKQPARPAARPATAPQPAVARPKPEKPTDAILQALNKAYWMEVETTINYIANSIDLDGVRAEEIKKSLQTDIVVEIGHAQSLGKRVKELGGRVEGSMAFTPMQLTLQPPKRSTDVIAVIQGVIDAENAAIRQYNETIRLCEGLDYVTQDLCIRLLADEEAHRQEFRGFLKEYERKG
jgi:bacterioferritin